LSKSLLKCWCLLKVFIKDNLASFGQFYFEEGNEDENIFLEEGIIKGMSWAHAQLEKYVGYNLLKLNATHLKAISQKCEIAGFAKDFHIKGKSE